MTKAGLLATVFATLLGATALAQEPIRIGAINPYSGPVALYGDEVARGYQLAIDEANAKGGVIGRKIELFRGDAGNPQQGIAAVEKLVSDKVDIFVGTYISAVSNAASDAAMRYSKIYWDTNALAADLTERGCRTSCAAGLFGELRRNFGERGARPARARVGNRSRARSLDRKRDSIWHLDREAQRDSREKARPLSASAPANFRAIV